MRNESLPVAVLAGGLATRLHPITERIPKALLHVAGEPFVFHQLRYLRSQGVQRVVLCVGHLGEMIQYEVGSGEHLGLRIDYSFDGPALMGTGGALQHALPMLGDAFFVLYGDSYLTIDYDSVERAFKESGQAALMTVFPNDSAWDASNVLYEAGKIIRYEKGSRSPEMKHIDYGLSVFTAAAFDGCTPGCPFDLSALQRQLVIERRMAALEVRQRFYEIGSPSGLAELDALLLHSRI